MKKAELEAEVRALAVALQYIRDLSYRELSSPSEYAGQVRLRANVALDRVRQADSSLSPPVNQGVIDVQVRLEAAREANRRRERTRGREGTEVAG